ncbi:Gfo/Idh/MocA family protein [Paenibacillus koleovorans]|uniref:Gfo/Idh/MocA family protein n=1 Tax=Paenibacillus koleovorans TaxID=121608 RepID=UPI000FD80B56|nr:Gfo/Idh/MocA family oxidoreductase [Paenibacillus koleovorans]
MDEIKIGLVGLDTSHAKVFTRIVNDPSFEHYMPGKGRVIAGYPGGSADFPASINRVEGYTNELSTQYGVSIVGSPEEVAEQVDLVLLTAVDGRVHRSLFERIEPYRKPVFVDKPFALRSKDAVAMAELAQENGIPLMTSSVRRFAPDLTAAIQNSSEGAVIGAECYGPLEFIPSQPGWFWYGIHTVEALYAIMGRGCLSVTTMTTGAPGEEYEVITGLWADGRIGLVRGNKLPNVSHGTVIHRENSSVYINTATDGLEKYMHLLSAAIDMARTGRTEVPMGVSLEIVRFIEAANMSRQRGETIAL